MFHSRYNGMLFVRSLLFPFLKIIAIIPFFHAVGIRLSDNHSVYSLASVFEMLAFNISMVVWSIAVSVPFFIYLRAASTSYDVIFDTPSGSTWIMVLCPLCPYRIPLFVL